MAKRKRYQVIIDETTTLSTAAALQWAILLLTDCQNGPQLIVPDWFLQLIIETLARIKAVDQ